MTKPMVSGHSKILMEVNMKETGVMINNMASEKRFGTMELRLMKAILLMARKTAKESFHGVMALTMKVIS